MLDSNNLTNAGVSLLKEQFRNGEGKLDQAPVVEPLWGLKHLSLCQNELHDLCLDKLAEMVKHLPNLETLDVTHNLFVTQQKIL